MTAYADRPRPVTDLSSNVLNIPSVIASRLKVSCEQTLLHHIHAHQFIDSPEWEANHEQSDDVFQVTIVAEDSCTYLCWPRMRLERVLRHRPMLKIVLDNLIGKNFDICKSISLNTCFVA